MSKNCSVYVDANTPPRYCCECKRIRIGEGECAVISLANISGVDLLYYPTGDTDETSIVHSKLDAGIHTILEPGCYKLDIDCAELDGTEAPEDPDAQILVCCTITEKSDSAILCACISDAIAEALGGELNVDVDLQPLIDKLCAGDVTAIAVLQEIIACLNASKVTDTAFHTALLACMNLLKVDLAAVLTCLTSGKAADATFYAAALACLNVIKTNTAAITGIETAFGQLGCIFVDDVQTGSVLVCKVSPEDGSAPVTQVHAYYTDGTVDTAYTGDWEPCSNLGELIEKTSTATILWGVREDSNFVDNQSSGELGGLNIQLVPSDAHDLVVTLSDGTICNEVIAGTANGVTANQEIADAMERCTGKTWTIKNGGGADGDTTTPFVWHASVTCCPGDLHVTSVVATVNAGKREGRVIPLLVGYKKGDVKKYVQVFCKGAPPYFLDAETGIMLLAAPDLTCGVVNCAFPAVDSCGCPTPVVCDIQLIDNLCLIQNPEDEETGEPTAIAAGFFQRFEYCEGKLTIITFTVVNNEEVIFDDDTLEGDQYFGDCDTLLPPDYDPPCPEGCVFTPARLVENYATWENTNYVNPTVGAVKAGDTIEVKLKNGTVLSPITIVKNSLFETKKIFEELGCVAKVHCDNWVIDGVDRCAKFPAWPTGKTKCPEFAGLVRADVYAAYLILTHCDPGMLPISTKIIASATAANVGATHHSVCCEGPEQKVSVCDSCDGIIVKDCTGKILTEVDPKCLQYDDGILSAVKVTKSLTPPGDTGSAVKIHGDRPPGSLPQALCQQDDTVIVDGKTLPELTDNAKALGYTYFNDTKGGGYLCPCPEITGEVLVYKVNGITSGKLTCLPLERIEGAPEKVLVEAICALRTIGCNDDRRDALLQCLKDCWLDVKHPCLRCAKFTIGDNISVENLITGAQGSTGAVEPFAEPVQGPYAFADAVTALGYVVDSIIGNVVTVCGLDIIFSYQLQDGTIVPADELTSKDGILVCDPAGTTAICAKLDKLIALWGTCDDTVTPPDPEEPECEPTVTSANGPGWIWEDGPSDGQTLTFPTALAAEPQDFRGDVAVDCDELEACLGADCTSVAVRFTFNHKQVGPGHSGFRFNVANSVAVATSTNNTSELNPNGSSSAVMIGTAAGDPDDQTYVDRWVDYHIPKSSLCAGVEAKSAGFDGFDGANVFDEQLNGITVEILGCAATSAKRKEG